MENITQYYCVDWFAMVFSMLGMYLVGHKYKQGFWFMTASSFCWVLFALFVSSPGCFIASFVNTLLSIKAYVNWTKKQKLEIVMNEARQSYDFMNVEENKVLESNE